MQMNAVARELGERGKLKARSASHVSEGMPPASAALLSLGSSTAPSLAPHMPPQEISAASPATPAANSFSPSIQLSAPAPALRQRSETDDAPLVIVLLEREERMRHEMEARTEQLRQEAKEEKAELLQDMQKQMDKLRKAMKPAPPTEAISEQQLVALQARIEATHAAKLLSDDELYLLEDLVADYLEIKTAVGIVTLDTLHASESVAKLLKLVGLSEGMVVDSAFARQVRRKFV